MIHRASALQKASSKMEKHFAHSQASRAATSRNGSDKLDMKNAPINTPVLVYRPELDQLDGAFRLHWVGGEECLVFFHYHRALRSSVQ